MLFLCLTFLDKCDFVKTVILKDPREDFLGRNENVLGIILLDHIHIRETSTAMLKSNLRKRTKASHPTGSTVENRL